MTDMLDALIGSAVYDPGGDKIGKVKRVYIDNDSGSPTWVAVSTGLFSDDSLVPLAGAHHQWDAGALQVQVKKELVKTAPNLAHNGMISPEAELELFDHYDIDPNRSECDIFGRNPRQAASPAPGRQRPDTGMVRSEERFDLGTEQEIAGRARMRRYLEAEDQTVEVPARREEVQVDREPITDPYTFRPYDIGEQEAEVTLRHDQMMVNNESGRAERVCLDVDEVEDSRIVSDGVREQLIDTQGVDDPDCRRR
ncbi:PRC and DUF2382 domain-containing protein [Nocardia sp. NBC_00881]|uniref:PRC and DUF2382 domain-containing protein n=1 Tax=Nocardia sp. NBC_00881 TaxID=2975995 RepID=UPI0038692CC8|nr:PRC and DUF2382 domain-containing protein [Nocardia sp. NBC_00881]